MDKLEHTHRIKKPLLYVFTRYKKQLRTSQLLLSQYAAHLSSKQRHLANSVAMTEYCRESLGLNVKEKTRPLLDEMRQQTNDAQLWITLYASVRFRNLMTYEGLAEIGALVLCDAQTKAMRVLCPSSTRPDVTVKISQLTYVASEKRGLSAKCREETGCVNLAALRKLRKKAAKQSEGALSPPAILM